MGAAASERVVVPRRHQSHGAGLCLLAPPRWMRRDRAGHALGARMDVIGAPDDLTITLRLGKPQKLLPLLLTKSQMSPPVIMPERFANRPARIRRSRKSSAAGRSGWTPDLNWKPGSEAFDLIRFDQCESPERKSRDFSPAGGWLGSGGPRAVANQGRSGPGLAGWRRRLGGMAAAGADLRRIGRSRDRRRTVSIRSAITRCSGSISRQGPMANQRIRQAILADIDQTGRGDGNRVRREQRLLRGAARLVSARVGVGHGARKAIAPAGNCRPKPSRPCSKPPAITANRSCW